MTRVQRYGGFLNAGLAEYVVPVNVGSIEVEFIDKPDLKFNSSASRAWRSTAWRPLPSSTNADTLCGGRN
jgi:hypothetical protein